MARGCARDSCWWAWGRCRCPVMAQNAQNAQDAQAKDWSRIAGNFGDVKVLPNGGAAPRAEDGKPDLTGRYYPNRAGRMLQGGYRLGDDVMDQYDAAVTPQPSGGFPAGNEGEVPVSDAVRHLRTGWHAHVDHHPGDRAWPDGDHPEAGRRLDSDRVPADHPAHADRWTSALEESRRHVQRRVRRALGGRHPRRLHDCHRYTDAEHISRGAWRLQCLDAQPRGASDRALHPELEELPHLPVHRHRPGRAAGALGVGAAHLDAGAGSERRLVGVPLHRRTRMRSRSRR